MHHLLFIYPPLGWFDETLPEVMIFPEDAGIMISGNISSNHPSGAYINDILDRKYEWYSLKPEKYVYYTVTAPYLKCLCVDSHV